MGAARNCVRAAADRGVERSEPAARSQREPATRDRRPPGARRESTASPQATPRRGPGARRMRRRRWLATRSLGDAAAAESAVVLEFITYSSPPNAWSTYRAALTAAGILHRTIVLAPTVEQIVDRLRSRGRSRDLAHLDLRRGEAAAQLACLDEMARFADLVVAADPRTAAEIAAAWFTGEPWTPTRGSAGPRARSRVG